MSAIGLLINSYVLHIQSDKCHSIKSSWFLIQTDSLIYNFFPLFGEFEKYEKLYLSKYNIKKFFLYAVRFTIQLSYDELN